MCTRKRLFSYLMNLFDAHGRTLTERNAPLADRLRPRTLDEFAGQEHIIGPGRLLRRAIQVDQLSSLIFYGPPGTGKTTLARIIAHTTKAQFLSINAVLAGVKDIREAIAEAREKLSLFSRRTILFIDEVHRFNKAQQDALLPHVENGTIILIGATTENPYFEVNKALVSRSRIFQLKSLTEGDLRKIAAHALSDKERGYGNRDVVVDDNALSHLVRVANGDARGVLNALELAVETTKPGKDGRIRITGEVAEDSIQRRAVLYDKDGDAHYDTVSAFIKSVRGSDPDAALYWMAKMLYAGEEPRFIFRRMVILASEDIGLADPHALGVVVSAARAFDYVGMPEGRYHLAHACLYLATAPKSNSTMAFFDAIGAVAKEMEDHVPNHLCDAARDKEGFGHGEGYLYPHAYRDHWVAQQYLPDTLQGKIFYDPSDQGYEQSIRQEVARRREAQIEAMVESGEGESNLPGGERPGAGQWAERSGGNSGERLAQVRDRILDLAELKRDSLVLDLHARTGLLTFEALRRVPEGGVWTATLDDRSHETITTMAQRFDALVRPQVMRTSTDKFVQDVNRAAGAGVAFDAIVGRNAMSRCADKPGFVRRAATLLRPGGRLVLAETLHGKTQRLSEYVTFEGQELAAILGEAEDSLFADPDDPMAGWSPQSLEDALAQETHGSALGLDIRISSMTFSPRYHISPADVEFWFREAQQGQRQSLGDRVRQSASDGQFEQIRSLVHRQLDDREIVWRTVVALLVVRLA